MLELHLARGLHWAEAQGGHKQPLEERIGAGGLFATNDGEKSRAKSESGNQRHPSSIFDQELFHKGRSRTNRPSHGGEVGGEHRMFLTRRVNSFFNHRSGHRA